MNGQKKEKKNLRNWQYLSLLKFGLSTVLFRRKDPILGTIILTDACNLHCRHCAVNNIAQRYLSVEGVRAEMRRYYQAGVRILFFCGGETFLWKDGELGLRDLVIEAKAMGFYLVNVVTNGTLGLSLPEADVVFLSLDGMREAHNQIRGDTFDTIMANLEKAGDSNVCVYMAINKINLQDIEALAQLVRDHPALRSRRSRPTRCRA
jgi:MoaA/NifB/PqqE/SkfB family radical SAM enzyme